MSARDIKLRVARAQLGTALALFMRDKDPLSVHALACGGCEIIEGLAESGNVPTLSTHILTTFPDMKARDVRRVRNQYWNAIKHFYKQDGKTAREDQDIMEAFSDEANDTPLYAGWTDFLHVTGRLPLEAQVYQVWWYATNEHALVADYDKTAIRRMFPLIVERSRAEQKAMLRRVIEKYRRNTEILKDPRTEVGPLMP